MKKLGIQGGTVPEVIINSKRGGGSGGLRLTEQKSGSWAQLAGTSGGGGLELFAEQKNGGLVIQARVTGSTGPVA